MSAIFRNPIRHYIFAVVFYLASGVFAAATDGQFPDRLTIMGKVLMLKEQKGTIREGLVVEYIPLGKTWEDWDLMSAVRFVPGEHLNPEASARATAANILERKKTTDPIANAIVFASEDNKSVVVDFLISSGNVDILEHNVWRFFKATKGLVSYQIARRVYSAHQTSEEMKRFIANIPTHRKKMLDELLRSDLLLPNLDTGN